MFNLFDSPYSRMIDFRIKPSKPVRHQQTCPVCGRTLVNTYRKHGVWKCKRCWDKEGEKHER